jgi:hypothetical protein
MSESNTANESRKAVGETTATEKSLPKTKVEWETPKLQDVSEEVMAQPYIRFT